MTNSKAVLATFVTIAIVMLLDFLIRFTVKNIYLSQGEMNVVELNNLFVIKYLTIGAINLMAFVISFLFLGKIRV
ncbi:MAG: hypothetical protein JWM28_951 [Chitinophagaceae bacterium]|nr:hypothetical protein [Chitinophagaceae bacterium]